MSHDELRMTLVEHLGELRTRMVRVAIAVMVGFFVTYAFHQELFDWLSAPIRSALAERGIYRLQAIEVAEAVFVYMKMSLIAGAMLVSPYGFYQIWAFVAPGLLPEEKRYVIPVSAFSSLFFLIGTAFAYYVLLPFVTGFLTDLTLEGDNIDLQVTMSSVYSFTFLALAVFGLIFQLPIAMFFLSLFGIADYRKFIKLFRYFVVAAFVIGAILTPPDPISQTMMAVPMVALYGLGIAMSFFVGKRKYDELGRRQPISGRLWWMVSAFILLIAGGIALLTQVLRPGAEPLQLIPNNAVWAVGAQTGSLKDAGMFGVMNSKLGAPPTIHDALTKLMANDQNRTFIWVGLPESGAAVLTKLSAEEADTLVNLLESAADDNAVGNFTISEVTNGVFGFGALEVIDGIRRCADDEAECLHTLREFGPVMADVPFRGPAFGIVPAPNVTWLSLIPVGTEIEHARYLAADWQPNTPPTLTLEVGTSGEASAKAYRTRIQVWKEQHRLEQTRRSQSNQRSQEISELYGLLALLAETMQAQLAPQGENSAASAAQRAAYDNARKSIADVRAKIRAAQGTGAPAVIDTTGGMSIFDRVPDGAIKDWDVSTSGDKLRVGLDIHPSAVLDLLTAVGKH